MPKAKKAGRLTEKQLDQMADGQLASEKYFSKGKMVPGVQRVNVDFTTAMLGELDRFATAVYVSRQAVIKMLLQDALNRHAEAQLAKQKVAKSKPN